MSWRIAQEVLEQLDDDESDKIKTTLEPYSFEQRRCICSITFDLSSLLFTAITYPNVSGAIYFLEKCGADPNSSGIMDGERWTCLYAAVFTDSVTLVDILLQHGANIEDSSINKKTALFNACVQNQFEMVKHLIKHGANINAVNDIGESCLMTSIDNIELFQYLILMGADINTADAWGKTVLMQAIEAKKESIIYLLLSLENIQVRLKNCYDEDALHLAIMNFSEDLIETIIMKGFYTGEELVQIYEQVSCLFHSMGRPGKYKGYWKLASLLRNLLNNRRLTDKEFPTGKLQKVVGLLELDDSSKLLYLESVNGLNNLLTLKAYMKLVLNISQIENYIILCQFYCDIVHSLSDRLFFGSIWQKEKLFLEYFQIDSSNKTSNMLKMFNLFENVAIAVRTRLEKMTPTERLSQVQIVESFINLTLVFLKKIHENMPVKMYLFYEGIKRIINADLRVLSQKSLLQLCIRSRQPIEFLELLCECRANVNSSDDEGKTVLHQVLESEFSNKMEIIKLMIDNGFNFHLVTFKEYCLPCRMEKQKLLPTPLKNITLQCLAARTFCEKKLICFSDIPRHLQRIVISHLHLP